MDKRILKLRAEKRKRQQEISEKREKDQKGQAKEIVKIADFLKRFVHDKRYGQYKDILTKKLNALINDLKKLKEYDPWKNVIESERLRAQIEQLETLLSQPEDFFEAKKLIEKKMPDVAKGKGDEED